METIRDTQRGLPRALGFSFAGIAVVAIVLGALPLPDPVWRTASGPEYWWKWIEATGFKPGLQIVFLNMARAYYVAMAYFAGSAVGAAIKYKVQLSAVSTGITHPLIYVSIYISLLFPVYFLPLANSKSEWWGFIMGEVSVLRLPLAFWLHTLTLLLLGHVTLLRGRTLGRSWLVVGPLIALAVEFTPGISWIPLLPTGIHAMTVGLGLFLRPSGSKS